MCAILDANVAHEVFGDARTELGIRFFEWIDNGYGRLVVGELLLDELDSTKARIWLREAIIAGRVRVIKKEMVREQTRQLHEQKVCKSNDLHIIALAQITRARLLYSNDRQLHQDFKNRNLINNPTGKVYSTYRHARLTTGHTKLLSQRDLCPMPKVRS